MNAESVVLLTRSPASRHNLGDFCPFSRLPVPEKAIEIHEYACVGEPLTCGMLVALQN